MAHSILITDPLDGARDHEPVVFTVKAELGEPLWWARDDAGNKVLCQRLERDIVVGESRFVACISFIGSCRLTLEAPCDAASEMPAGIAQLEGREADCFVRLDTGAFDLELCSGTAEGLGSSKWGIRHFKALSDGVELLPSGNNAIGGFYGPFFTPENGLINPPEHTTVRIETLEQGPVLHHYRMHGVIPDGLLEELKGKHFAIDWMFTYGTPFFQRRYVVDPFQTVINGRSVTDKITVGDEFEAARANWSSTVSRPLAARATGRAIPMRATSSTWSPTPWPIRQTRARSSRNSVPTCRTSNPPTGTSTGGCSAPGRACSARPNCASGWRRCAPALMRRPISATGHGSLRTSPSTSPPSPRNHLPGAR